MKIPRNTVPAVLFAGLAMVGIAFAANQISYDAGGIHIGDSATQDKIGLYGVTPVVQPTSAAQAALTDSTTGTAGTALAAGVGINTVTIPLTSLATGLSTSAIDLLTEYVPGYRFKVLGFAFVTTVAGTGTSASQVFNLEIETTNVTGGVLTLTLASQATIGTVTSATAVTAANVGTAAQKLSIEMAAGGTAFTAGAGYFVIKLQNLDTADAVASLANLANALRTANVAVGVAKGS